MKQIGVCLVLVGCLVIAAAGLRERKKQEGTE